MKASIVVLCSLLLASCGAGVRRMSMAARPADTVARAVVADPDQDREMEPEDSPGEAVEFYLLKRTGGGPLPVEKLLEAKRHKDSMPARTVGTRRVVPVRPGESPRGVDVGTWQGLGPGNVGGRTLGFAIRPDDPNTMYAGAAGGGVWKTVDGGNTWNPIGDLLPSIGISTLAMDPNDPNTLYAGTGEYYTASTRGDSIRGAGIFKTTDGGNTWIQLPKPVGGNAFDYTNKVVVSPNNSQHIYTVDWVGVYYSPDGGNTWQLQLNRSGNMLGCQDLVIRTDQATDYLFAACSYGGSANPALYRNVDAAGAGKWEIVFTTGNMARTSLALAPSNQSIVYAAVSGAQTGTCPTDNSTPQTCYNNALLGVWRSTSNGDSGSWTQQVSYQDSNFLNTLLFTNPRGGFADICSGGTSKKSWSNQGWYDNVIAVDPANSNVVWVGGVDLFRSDDGGQNWGIAAFWELENGEPQGAHADHHVLAFSPGYNGADNQTLFDTSDGGIYRTDNALAPTATGDRAACSPYSASVVWQNVNNGYAVTQFYQGSVYPGGGAYLGGSQDNNMERGSDATGPNAWTEPNHIGDGGFSAIDPTDPNIWYIEGVNLGIQKTTNGGATFSTATKGITEPGTNFLFIAPFVMDPGNSKRLYAGGKTLWRTTDGAANWSEASSAVPSTAGSISAIAVSPSDPNHVAFGTSTGLVFTNTAALTSDKTTVWTSTQPRTGYVSGLTFDPNNASTIYATYSQYKSSAAQSHLYRSTDGGASWNGIDGTGATGLPDIPVYTLIVDPQNAAMLYLGTDIGLFASTDSGATWSRDNNPFADAVTEALVLDRSAGQNNLFAFTHGRGVWKTVLPGSSPPCQYSLSGNAVKFPAYGSSSTINVTTGDNCTWSVVPTSSSFTVTSPAVGKGKGAFTVGSRSLNSTPQTRIGQVTVQDQAVSIIQDAALVGTGNDESASAFSVGALPAVVVEDTTGATEAASDPVHSCTKSADFKTVWFSMSTPTAGKATVLINDTQLNGADAGAVLSLYTVVNGKPGPEFWCSVHPQKKTGGTLGGVTFTTRAGDNYLIEVSATTFGAAADASLIGGLLELQVTLQ